MASRCTKFAAMSVVDVMQIVVSFLGGGDPLHPALLGTALATRSSFRALLLEASMAVAARPTLRKTRKLTDAARTMVLERVATVWAAHMTDAPLQGMVLSPAACACGLPNRLARTLTGTRQLAYLARLELHTSPAALAALQTEELLTASLGQLQALQELRLVHSGSTGLDDLSTAAVVQALPPSMRTLHVSEHTVGIATCAALASVSFRLERLLVVRCPGFNDRCVALVRQNLPQLRRVWLESTFDVSDAGLVAEGCPALEYLTHLSLRYCWRVTDSGLKAFLAKHPTVMQINTEGCIGVKHSTERTEQRWGSMMSN